MSRNEFADKIPEGWFNVGRFSKISATEDGQREFLEAIHDFRESEVEGNIPIDGIDMPDIGELIVGKILNLDFLPDGPTSYPGCYSDGLIIVRCASYNQ